VKTLFLATVFAAFLASFGALWLQKWMRDRSWKRPFSDKRLRSAGETLRRDLEKLDDKWTDLTLQMATAVALPVGVSFLVNSRALENPAVFELFFGIVAGSLVLIAFLSVKGLRHIRRRWNLALGLDGECFVGQVLESELLPKNCKVYHDLQMDGFNIDHVVLAPTGVFAVETKTRRKPRIGKSDPDAQKAHEIVYDGKTLAFPCGMSAFDALEQAESRTRALAQLLLAKTGGRVDVRPVLVYPGWFIARKGVSLAEGRVAVMNPKTISSVVFPNGAGRNGGLFCEENQYNRIDAALRELCTLTGE
jgi:hypothetical protein